MSLNRCRSRSSIIVLTNEPALPGFHLNFPFRLRHIRPDQLLIGSMFFRAGPDRSFRPRQNAGWPAFYLFLLLQLLPFAGLALPKQLILGLDGIAYRDLQ